MRRRSCTTWRAFVILRHQTDDLCCQTHFDSKTAIANVTEPRPAAGGLPSPVRPEVTSSHGVADGDTPRHLCRRLYHVLAAPTVSERTGGYPEPGFSHSTFKLRLTWSYASRGGRGGGGGGGREARGQRRSWVFPAARLGSDLWLRARG